METPYFLELSKEYSFPIKMIVKQYLFVVTPKERSSPVGDFSFDVFLLKNSCFVPS